MVILELLTLAFRLVSLGPSLPYNSTLWKTLSGWWNMILNSLKLEFHQLSIWSLTDCRVVSLDI